MKTGGQRLSRRALGGILAAAAAPAPAARQDDPPPPAGELDRARTIIRTQGRAIAEAAAQLEPEIEPAFRFEA